jgi:hypothetical protein
MGEKKISYADGRTGATPTVAVGIACPTPMVAVGIACPTPTAKLRRRPRSWAIISDPMPISPTKSRRHKKNTIGVEMFSCSASNPLVPSIKLATDAPQVVPSIEPCPGIPTFLLPCLREATRDATGGGTYAHARTDTGVFSSESHASRPAHRLRLQCRCRPRRYEWNRLSCNCKGQHSYAPRPELTPSRTDPFSARPRQAKQVVLAMHAPTWRSRSTTLTVLCGRPADFIVAVWTSIL